MTEQFTTPPTALPTLEKERILFDACPLCQSHAFALERSADCTRHPSWRPPLSPTLQWMRCDSCGHSFTDGYYTSEALDIVFEHIQHNQRPGDDLEKNRALSAGIIEKVLPYKSSGAWLDVGFGNGSLLFTAEEYGFDVLGLDLRQEAVAAMADLGYNVRCADIEASDDLEDLDVISMADVLEHTPHPDRILKAVARALKPGGVVFLSMPNAGNRLWSALTQENTNPYWNEIEHYHNFSRTNLYRLLGEAGFDPVRFGISERYRCGMEIVALKR